MTAAIEHYTTCSPISIELDAHSILPQLVRNGNKELIQEELLAVLDQTKKVWSPRAILRPMNLMGASAKRVTLTGMGEEIVIHLRMGHAGTFLQQAEQVVVGAYTVGRELEKAGSQATGNKDYLAGYLYEVVAAEALAKVGSAVNQVIEKEAASRGWKVGPLLSPGSVHGWELSEQSPFCELLDLASAGIYCSDVGVLTPFNSLSFIIGIGPGYTNEKVGSPCEVCSCRETCAMKSGQ